ncbi:unnamed protein product [Sphagnum jensenii]|uniref:Inositol monophosphatase n=1 Tax=Sphagnum jensenii TaxID=128206 RepID=A0ABP0VIR0_9BRYO
MRETAVNKVMPYFGFGKLKAEEIQAKAAGELVTIADTSAEQALSKRLLDVLPGALVIGEEAYAKDPSVIINLASDSPVWIIDPVDGTSAFAKGEPRFGMIVALAVKQEIVAGWIYNPVTDQIAVAEKGAGVYFHGERLKTLPATDMRNMRGLFGYKLIDACKKSSLVKDSELIVEPTGAACFDYLRLLFDKPHFGRDESQIHCRALSDFTSPWDDAAGILMHREAGGYADHWDGAAYDLQSPHDKGLLLAPDHESWLSIRDWCGTLLRKS